MTFAKNKDFTEARELQKNILDMYEDDFSKHVSGRELPRVRLVWNSIPIQLEKENKKFFFGKMKQGARAKDFEMAIEWMLDCGLIQKVYRINKPGMPLKAYMEFSAFKLFLLDVGLLGALSDLNAKSILEGNMIFEEFKGALTAQYVVQQLTSDTDYTPFYFAPGKSNVEIDVMVQKESDVVPVEVKAAENLRSKSLKTYCEKHVVKARSQLAFRLLPPKINLILKPTPPQKQKIPHM